MIATKWDLRFLELAKLISRWSKDPSTQTGAVITRLDHTIVSLGFNGLPTKMPDYIEYYENRELKYSRIVHCEINAAVMARQDLRGTVLYTWPFASCDRCCVQMIQAGIIRFVFPEPSTDVLSRWGDSLEKTKEYIEECGCYWKEIPLNEIN